MANQYKIGLTIGKFAPLHKGHQFLIETALRDMDELVVMVYDQPDVTDVPLHVRSGWIKRLYPKAKVIEAYDSPKRIGKDDEAIRAQVDYILEKVRGMDITHFYSSEWYGKFVAEALHAQNVLVDPERKMFPISGSLTRENLEKHKDMLDKTVYADVKKYFKK
ncbi:MAG: adenylyltransferase/cytidyltransferase family protein [Candidatus Paceibacterota bacterium]|jgi:cytidyltransferase-like protein